MAIMKRLSKGAILSVIALLTFTITVFLYKNILRVPSSLSPSQYKNISWNITKTAFRMGPVYNVNASVQPSTNAHVRSFGGNQTHDGNSAFHKRTIRILTWTYRSGNREYWFDERPTGIAQCNTPIPCVFSNNHSLYNFSDVIMFHTRLAGKNNAMPPYRLPHQHWITYLRESPLTLDRRKIKQPHNAWFNWTIAYTKHADIFLPYGMCLPKRGKVEVDPSSLTDTIRRAYGSATDSIPWEKRTKKYKYTPINHAIGKTRKVLWAVSNCRTYSRRETYVEELKRHIEIDIIGECGDVECSKHCILELYRNHKFYLAFENSLCADYITEKVWHRLRVGIVPIVLGGADYKSFLPAHSYIDVRDFSSPKALALYLHKLDNDDKLYNEYFAWKQNYSCQGGLPGKNFLCDICRFMNENINEVNIIPDINRFWSINMCLSPEKYYGGRIKGL